jgi:hypothetical protein
MVERSPSLLYLGRCPTCGTSRTSCNSTCINRFYHRFIPSIQQKGILITRSKKLSQLIIFLYLTPGQKVAGDFSRPRAFPSVSLAFTKSSKVAPDQKPVLHVMPLQLAP